MRLTITAKCLDGLGFVIGNRGVQVINVDTNEVLENVTRVKWECSVGGIARAMIELIGTEIDAEGLLEGKITKNSEMPPGRFWPCTCDDVSEPCTCGASLMVVKD